MDQCKWDLERSISEFILNQGTISNDFLIRVFQGSVFSSLRWLADELSVYKSSGILDVINNFDPDNKLGLLDKFDPLLNIRRDHNLYRRYSLEDIIAGPVTMLQEIQDI